MGLYEYRCRKCENVYKIWKHVMPTENEALCNKCGGKGIEVLGVAYVDFRGSGFYENDYKNKEVALPSEDD
jgi:putative FmdB family regulatory protein